MRKERQEMGGSWSVVVGIMVVLVGVARSGVEEDKAECMEQLIGLATCLPYVGGEARAPTLDCCSGVRQVVHKSMKCLCILVKDKDDPTLGLNINDTIALGLPATCQAPTNLTKCIDLLHLPLNSTLAKLFENFEKDIETKNSTLPGNSSGSGSGSPSNADVKSDGGQRMLGSSESEMLFLGLSALFFTLPHHIF